MILSFSGLDGCGKSSIIEAITERVNNKHSQINVKCIWTRVGYTPFINFLKDCLRKSKLKSVPSPGRSRQRTNTLNKKPVRFLWISISLLELIYIFSIKLRFRSNKDLILLDRQIDDSIIDLSILFGEDIQRSWYVKVLLYVLKVTSVNYYKIGIEIDLPTSDYRCSIKYEPFPDLPEEKIIRHKYYEKALSSNAFSLILNGIDPIENSLEKVMDGALRDFN
ncbi:hypothetical protein E2K93_01525 [Thalassotalea sp. HSM 43]|uniref:hypothetical protein n=1 Tax=Thalassotalea sp. HSM 43 TaxID=2552945 RepID=UPI00107FDF45|nr:hypothetical protein [Thalassotalea sp. HSM 43]QBY03127.1 hypothetical protein E2K93_01525 [Thalassotalea sp. HSM 43]